MDMQESVYIFMEICEGGTLLEFIQDKDPLKDCKAWHLSRSDRIGINYGTISQFYI
jgi:hypothetical protein